MHCNEGGTDESAHFTTWPGDYPFAVRGLCGCRRNAKPRHHSVRRVRHVSLTPCHTESLTGNERRRYRDRFGKRAGVSSCPLRTSTRTVATATNSTEAACAGRYHESVRQGTANSQACFWHIRDRTSERCADRFKLFSLLRRYLSFGFVLLIDRHSGEEGLVFLRDTEKRPSGSMINFPIQASGQLMTAEA